MVCNNVCVYTYIYISFFCFFPFILTNSWGCLWKHSQVKGLYEDGVPTVRNHMSLLSLCGMTVWEHANLKSAAKESDR